MFRSEPIISDVAMTERPPSSALLLIDSEDRFRDYEQARADPGSSPYDFTIKKSQNLMSGFFTRVAVSEIVFNWTLPNINILTNVIIVSFGPVGGPYATANVTLTPGFKNPSTIASELQAAIITATGNPSFTMTYGTITLPGPASAIVPNFEYKTNNPALAIGFAPLPSNSAIPGSGTFPIYTKATTKQLFDILGFTVTNQNPAVSGYGGSTMCRAVRYVDVVSNELTYNQALRDTMSQTIGRDSLCRIYLNEDGTSQTTVLPNSPSFSPTGCAPFTIHRQFATPKYIQWNRDQPISGSLRFTVYDDTGTSLANYPILPTPLNRRQTENWSMTLLVSEN